MGEAANIILGLVTLKNRGWDYKVDTFNTTSTTTNSMCLNSRSNSRSSSRGSFLVQGRKGKRKEKRKRKDERKRGVIVTTTITMIKHLNIMSNRGNNSMVVVEVQTLSTLSLLLLLSLEMSYSVC